MMYCSRIGPMKGRASFTKNQRIVIQINSSQGTLCYLGNKFTIIKKRKKTKILI